MIPANVGVRLLVLNFEFCLDVIFPVCVCHILRIVGVMVLICFISWLVDGLLFEFALYLIFESSSCAYYILSAFGIASWFYDIYFAGNIGFCEPRFGLLAGNVGFTCIRIGLALTILSITVGIMCAVACVIGLLTLKFCLKLVRQVVLVLYIMLFDAVLKFSWMGCVGFYNVCGVGLMLQDLCWGLRAFVSFFGFLVLHLASICVFVFIVIDVRWSVYKLIACKVSVLLFMWYRLLRLVRCGSQLILIQGFVCCGTFRYCWLGCHGFVVVLKSLMCFILWVVCFVWVCLYVLFVGVTCRFDGDSYVVCVNCSVIKLWMVVWLVGLGFQPEGRGLFVLLLVRGSFVNCFIGVYAPRRFSGCLCIFRVFEEWLIFVFALTLRLLVFVGVVLYRHGVYMNMVHGHVLCGRVCLCALLCEIVVRSLDCIVVFNCLFAILHGLVFIMMVFIRIIVQIVGFVVRAAHLEGFVWACDLWFVEIVELLLGFTALCYAFMSLQDAARVGDCAWLILSLGYVFEFVFLVVTKLWCVYFYLHYASASNAVRFFGERGLCFPLRVYERVFIILVGCWIVKVGFSVVRSLYDWFVIRILDLWLSFGDDRSIECVQLVLDFWPMLSVYFDYLWALLIVDSAGFFLDYLRYLDLCRFCVLMVRFLKITFVGQWFERCDSYDLRSLCFNGLAKLSGLSGVFPRQLGACVYAVRLLGCVAVGRVQFADVMMFLVWVSGVFGHAGCLFVFGWVAFGQITLCYFWFTHCFDLLLLMSVYCYVSLASGALCAGLSGAALFPGLLFGWHAFVTGGDSACVLGFLCLGLSDDCFMLGSCLLVLVVCFENFDLAFPWVLVCGLTWLTFGVLRGFGFCGCDLVLEFVHWLRFWQHLVVLRSSLFSGEGVPHSSFGVLRGVGFDKGRRILGLSNFAVFLVVCSELPTCEGVISHALSKVSTYNLLGNVDILWGLPFVQVFFGVVSPDCVGLVFPSDLGNYRVMVDVIRVDLVLYAVTGLLGGRLALSFGPVSAFISDLLWWMLATILPGTSSAWSFVLFVPYFFALGFLFWGRFDFAEGLMRVTCLIGLYLRVFAIPFCGCISVTSVTWSDLGTLILLLGMLWRFRRFGLIVFDCGLRWMLGTVLLGWIVGYLLGREHICWQELLSLPQGFVYCGLLWSCMGFVGVALVGGGLYAYFVCKFIVVVIYYYAVDTRGHGTLHGVTFLCGLWVNVAWYECAVVGVWFVIHKLDTESLIWVVCINDVVGDSWRVFAWRFAVFVGEVVGSVTRACNLILNLVIFTVNMVIWVYCSGVFGVVSMSIGGLVSLKVTILPGFWW
eukprot:gene3140-2122_t